MQLLAQDELEEENERLRESVCNAFPILVLRLVLGYERTDLR